MIEEQGRRKQRVPLSPKELYYFVELKKLKQAQKIEKFKLSPIYKLINRINIALVAILTYCLLSIITLNYWQKSYILKVNTTYATYDPQIRAQSIAELKIDVTSGEHLEIKTNDLYDLPQAHQEIYLGKDFLFHKILKAKLSYDERPFWTINSYAHLTVSCFALFMGFFIYKVDKHLTINGLLVTFGLLLLAGFYFLLV